MLHHDKSDDAVARALLARRNPVLEAVLDRDRADGRAAGFRQGKAKAVIMMLGARGIAGDGASRERILGETDVHRFDRWITRAATCTAIVELFDEP